MHSIDLQEGSYRSVFSDENLLVFARETSESETLVLINSGDNSREVTLSKGIDIFYNSYVDVRNNLSLSLLDNTLTFEVNQNDFAVFTYINESIIDNVTNHDVDNFTEINTNETNNGDDHFSDVLTNETNDIVDDNKEGDINSGVSVDDNLDDNQSGSEVLDNQSEESTSSTTTDIQEEENFLLLRGLLFITFLSLLITFIYTRRG